MKRVLFICLWLGSFLATTQIVDGQVRPAWVYHPPRISSHLVSIGVAKPYLEDSLTFAFARRDAIVNLVKQYQVHIVTKLAESEKGMQIRTVGYTTETFDSTLYQKCLKNAQVLDSVLTKQNGYVLMYIRQDLSPPDSSLNVEFSSALMSNTRQPAWIMAPPSSNGEVYGVGVSGRYRRESDSWDHATKYARREIALALLTEKSSLRKDIESDAGDVHLKWSEDIADITLGLNRVVERWYDPEYDLFYCLVSYQRK